MLKVSLSLSALAFASTATAQNLVPNPSFEDTALCGVPVYSMIETAPPWFTPNNATPDIYELDLTTDCAYPYDQTAATFWGVSPGGTGARMAGAIFYELYSDVKEYVGVELVQSLATDSLYTVRLKYRLGASCQFALYRIGAMFTSQAIHQADPYTILGLPQVELSNGAPLDATQQWVTLQGSYSANGSERFIVIGSFEDTANVELYQRPGSNDPQTYYFLDEVTVEPDQSTEIGTDTEMRVLIDGSSALVDITDPVGMYRWNLFDLSGRLLASGGQSLFPGRNHLILGREPGAGAYVLELIGRSRMLARCSVLE